MTSLSNYSKFDHLYDSDDDSTDRIRASKTSESSAGSGHAGTQNSLPARDHPATGLTDGLGPRKMEVTKRGSEKGRFVFECDGRKIYEWDQNLEEVNIYIEKPPHLKSASQVICNITPTRLQLGLKMNTEQQWYLNHSTFSKIQKMESSWYINESEIHIILIKAHKGGTWDSPFQNSGGIDGTNPTAAGSDVDPVTKTEIQRDMMLERFQEEHPGFDFRDATFNGAVPDPRTFMGGVSYG